MQLVCALGRWSELDVNKVSTGMRHCNGNKQECMTKMVRWQLLGPQAAGQVVTLVLSRFLPFPMSVWREAGVRCWA